jgi:hypothetical protein
MTTVTADIAVSLEMVEMDDGVGGLAFDIGRVRATEQVVHLTLRPAGR